MDTNTVSVNKLQRNVNVAGLTESKAASENVEQEAEDSSLGARFMNHTNDFPSDATTIRTVTLNKPQSAGGSETITQKLGAFCLTQIQRASNTGNTTMVNFDFTMLPTLNGGPMATGTQDFSANLVFSNNNWTFASAEDEENYNKFLAFQPTEFKATLPAIEDSQIAVDGYTWKVTSATPDGAGLGAETLSPYAGISQNIVIDYTKEEHTVTYKFKDPFGNQVGRSVPVTGATGSNQSVSLTLPDGYQLASDSLPTSVTIPTSDQTIWLPVKHQLTITLSGEGEFNYADDNWKNLVKTNELPASGYYVDFNDTNARVRLDNGDVTYNENRNAGTYTVSLTEKGLNDIKDQLHDNFIYPDLKDVKSEAKFIIDKGNKTISLMGGDTKVFDNTSTLPDQGTFYSGLGLADNDQGRISVYNSDGTLRTIQLTPADVEFWFNGHKIAKDQAKNVGTYNLRLTDDFINKVKAADGNNGNNYEWAYGTHTPTGSDTYTADYVIYQATGKANLSGNNSKLYDGNAVTTTDVNKDGKITIDLTLPVYKKADAPGDEPQLLRTVPLGKYTLQDGDYTWANGTAPTKGGSYTIKLNKDKILAHLQNRLVALAGVGTDPDDSTKSLSNVTITTDDMAGQATFAIETTTAYQFVDDDDNGSKVGTPVSKTGLKGESSAISLDVPTNYVLAAGQTLPTSVIFGDTNTRVDIHLKHATKTVDKNNVPDGYTKDDFAKTINRTITAKEPTGDVDLSQTTELTRTGIYDEVTKKVISYGNWTTGNFDEVTAPEVAGYTPSQASVAAVTGVTIDYVDPKVVISYTADSHTLNINYVDKDGNKIGSPYQVPGKTDQTVSVDVPGHVPTNWELVPNQKYTTSITFGSDDPQDQNYVIQHETTKTDGRDHKDNQDLYREVTRTILMSVPNATSQGKETETLSFYRIMTHDEVTGDNTYTPWTSDVVGDKTAFDEFDVSKTNDGKEIAAGYTPNAQKTTVTYVDKDGKEIANPDGSVIPGSHYDLTGVTDQSNVPTNIQNNVPTNWHITDETFPGTISFGPDGHTPIAVYVAHNTKPADKDNVPDGYKKEDFDKTVIRTITAKEPSGDVDLSQKTELTRTGTYDEVTKEVTYNPWTTSSFVEVKAPKVTGYTPSKASVEAVSEVTVDYVDPKVVISYTADSHTLNINYVDKDGNKIGNPYQVPGRTDETVAVDVPGHVPANWELVPNQKYTTSITFGSDDPQDQNYVIQHKTTTTDGRDHKDNQDLYREVTRTILMKVPNATSQGRETETLSFYRIMTHDEVTGDNTYTPWTSDVVGDKTAFDEFDVSKTNDGKETAAGYTPTSNDVVLEDKNGDKFVPSQSALKNGVPADSFTVEVAYTPNAQKTTVTYVDKDGKEIANPDGSVIPGSHYDLTGVTDQSNVPTNIQNNVPTNWHITDPDVPATITFGADGHTPITVHVAHNIKTVDKNDVPDNYKESDFSKTINRTITAKEPTGDVDLSQKTELTRTGTYDEVTKKVVSYSDWTTDKFAEVSAPNVPGYTPSQAKVDGADVTVDSKFDPTVITYAPNAQKTTVTYVDKNGKEITNPDGSAITGSHYDVDGVTDQKNVPTNIEKNVPTNWHITDKTIPGTISFGPNGHDPIKVHVAHNTKPADKDNVPDGYKREDFDKTVTRTITAKEPSGDVDLSQHVELTRTGTYDEVTKEVTYNPWTTSSFVEVTAPEVAGYTPSKASVEAVDKVTSDYVDPKVVINYVPNDQKGKISYVDDKTNTEVGTTSLTGKTDEDVVINPVAPAGWKIVEGQNIPKTEKATPNGIDTVIVKVEHKTTTVPPTDPKTPEDKLPDNPDKHYPDGVGEKDLNKTIVRQITVVKPDGTRENHDQSVKLTRSATVDEVTGAITGYSDWTTGNFDEYDAPVIAGYTPSQAKVDGVKVTADSDFDPVVITYVEDPIGQDITVKKGDTPSPEDGVKNHGDLDKITDPKHPGTKTTYTWEKTPNTNVPGDVPATVIVHYPDGSNKPVDITVHVVDDTPVVPTKNPDPIGQDITVKKGDTPDPEDGVKNHGDLDKIIDPKHPGTKTTYTWKKTPDTSVAGDVPATVIVHYPDGSNKPVDITIHVVDDTPVVPTKNPDPIGQDITVKKGDTPDPEDGVKNHGDLDKITDPKHPGTKTTYTWKKTPDTSVASDVPATVIVHYPDGSNKPVDITVHVVDDTPVVPTKNPEPAGQDIHTPQGKVPTPESAITNKDKMPDGTKYTWKEIPDVNTLGKHPSVVVVTYPDGTAVEVKVNVFVDGTPEAKKETKAPVVKKQVVEPTKVETRQKLVNNYVAPRAVEVQRAQAKGKRQLPQTGAKENIASEVLGMLSVGLGALTAGFASKRRKKNR